MRARRSISPHLLVRTLAGAGLTLALGCSANNGGEAASGGSGQGGVSAGGSAGAMASGGVSTTTGGAGTSGSTGTGGSSTTGGQAGSAGTSASAGTGGSGGGAQGGATSGSLLLHADPTNRFLVNGDDQPFLFFGEGAWTLNSQLDISDQNAYLDTRSAQGLNAFGLQLISRYQDNSPNDVDNVAPFTTPGDFSTFNVEYFEKAADVVSRAGEHGMVVFIAPCWAGYDSSQGFYDTLVANGTTKLQDYGVAVANVFESFDNVIWLIGGDRPAPVGSTELFDALTAGIRSVDSRHLVTSHWNFASGDTPSGDWEDIVSTYNWNGGAQYPQIQGEYEENDAPVVLLEALYELNTSFGATTKILRFQTIQALLFGAKGTFFGHEGVWHLGASENLPSQSQGHPYDLDSVGIHHQQRINEFFKSRAWQDLVPDLSHGLVTDGLGSYGSTSYIGAAKTPDGKLGVIYVPNGGSVTVELGQLTLPLTAQWYDPTSGDYSAAGTFSVAASQAFTVPGNNSATENDWLLLLESD